MDKIQANQTVIDLAGHKVPVVKGGLYDRFRSNPPLSVIAEEAPDIDLSWFKTIPKEKKDVGFITYSPNFYYKNSSITAIYTADLARLKALIPAEIHDVARPISILPGRGLVAITAYAYHYCDNDSYNELSIAIVTTKTQSGNRGLFSLLGQLKNKSMWGYVLKLPVDTELARVRGVVGYNLPKWLIPIDFKDKGDTLTFDIYDEAGQPDFSLEGKKLAIENAEAEVSRTNFVNLNAKGEPTHGYTDVRALQKGRGRKKDDFKLRLGKGPLSEYLKAMDLGKLIRYDYQPYFQATLYTPEVLTKK